MTTDSAPPNPTIITPDDPASAQDEEKKAAKKARRQTAFYPNVNSTNKQQKPFSRSAAKRESVMALGSIEHLQHYFTKTGIAARKSPTSKAPKGSVPAIGGLNHIKSASLSVNSDIILPQTPALPRPAPPAFPPFVKTYETDPDSLVPGVIDDLSATARAWGISQDAGSSPDPSRLNSPNRSNTFDVLGVLKTTTRVVRTVRNYVVSLPDESTGHIRAQFRPMSLQSITPKKAKRSASVTREDSDPLALIRKSALEVLSVLRELEESTRVPLSDEAYDAQSDHGSSNGRSPSPGPRVASPSNLSAISSDPPDNQEPTDVMDADGTISYSVIRVHGRYETVPVWAEEEDSYNLSDDEQEKREIWDERLVVGGGWLYKQDITLESLASEKVVVARYLDVVDAALFGGSKKDQRGWERERNARQEKALRDGRASKMRKASSDDGGRRPLGPRPSRSNLGTPVIQPLALSEEPEAEEEEEEEEDYVEGYVDDEDLPNWAKRVSFPNDDIGRAHAVLTTFLPVDLLSALPSPRDRIPFLEALSYGQLLCVAYNTAVRKSKRQWGFINKDAIHDIIALKAAVDGGEQGDSEKDKSKREWTFRRTDNLRLWIGALKLRYMLPITAPSQAADVNIGPGGMLPSPTPSPSSPRFPANEVPILFDAKAVARRGEGWDGMLEEALLRWTKAVVDEKRVHI